MSGKKILDMSTLMRGAGSTPTASLPGVHGRRQSPDTSNPVDREGDTDTASVTEPAQPSEQAEPAATETVKEPPVTKTPKQQKSSTTKAKRAPSATKQTARPAATPAKRAPASGGGGEEPSVDELVSLDGRPARLWDISAGKPLPSGWAKIAVERVHAATRKFRADRRNATLPDNVYAACNDYIYEEARSGGLDLTLSNLAEAAFEQIPQDDEASIQRLLDTLPDAYYGKGMPTRPRTFQLFDPTLQQMQNLARMLRALGFTSMTGLVQTAALRELLLDLGMEVD